MNITEWLTTPTQEATHKKQTRQPKLTRSHNLYKTTVTVKYHGFILQTCLTLLFCKIHSKNISAVKYAQRANITSTAPQQNMLQKNTYDTHQRYASHQPMTFPITLYKCYKLHDWLVQPLSSLNTRGRFAPVECRFALTGKLHGGQK